MANTIDLNADIPEKEFTDIELICRAADLEVTRSDDDTAHISFRNVPEGSFAKAENNKLIIDIRKPSVTEMIFHNPLRSRSCRVSLPEKLYGSLIIKTGLGNGSISGVQCSTAGICSGVGNTSLNNFRALKELRIESGTGNVNADSLECGSLSIKSGTGTVKVKGVAGSVDIKGGTGNISYEGSVNGDIGVKGGVGDIDLVLDKECSDRGRVNTAHGIGKVNIIYV